MKNYHFQLQIIPILICILVFIGISHSTSAELSNESCMDDVLNQVQEAERIDFIYSLDHQKIFLQEFYDECNKHGPPVCAIFEKFYYWKSAIKQVTSMTHDGLNSHTIRVYYNPVSVCYPELVNPLRIYGDIAEFYDVCGEFMGIAVYMGNGEYFPLKFSGYSKRNWIFPSPLPNAM